MKYLILLLFPVLTIAQDIKLPLTAGSYYRSCELRNRTCVEINLSQNNIGTNNVLHSVTSGKTLYIESICYSVSSTGGGLSGPAAFEIRDNTTVKYGDRAANGQTTNECLYFGKNPAVFNTNFNVNETDTTATVSIWATGYEE